MANINKIRLSGTTYNIEDQNAAKSVTLTQAEYDALVTKDPNTFYIISDSTIDYVTSAETQSAITQAVSGKQDTLSAGTGIDITDNVISVTGGGGASYSAGTGIDITNDVISVTGKVDTSTYETYTAATATAIGNKLATSDFNTYSGTVDTAINSKASQSDLSTLSGTVTAHTANTDIHVTTAQTAAWNAKSDFSGSYNDLTDKPTIPTVPTSNTAFTNDAGYITSDAISGKADTSAVTESINAAVSGKVDTSTFNTYSGSVETALSGKQDTLSAGTGIDITDNVISATGGGGGGKAIEAGRGISITTGETADTINCTVPASASSGNYSIMFGQPASSGDASGSKTITGGQWSKAYAEGSVAIGQMNESRGSWAWAIGNGTSAVGQAAFACGEHNSTNNQAEFTCGYATITSGGSDTSIMTLFTVGNGKYQGGYQRHNALDIRMNGDIYIPDTNSTSTSNYWQKPMIKLQDALGGGGASYSAGTGIDITNDVISVTGKVDTSAITTSITSSSTDVQVPSAKAVNDKLGGLSIVKLTESEYAALVTKDSNTLYCVVHDPSN